MIMRVTLLSSFLFLLNIFFLNAQDLDTNLGNSSSSYGSYFELPRESMYVHLNKDKFVKGEALWFKGYVYNRRTHKPFASTTNVYLGVYDSLGIQKSKYLYYAEDGFFNGNIQIDSTFTDGKYYVKASTNWMRNFKEDDAYVQQIEILSKSYNDEKGRSTLTYDVQLLPEGGNLVSGLPNVIGVKILDSNGLGVAIKNIKLQDASGKQLVLFNTNQFGMGKFEFTPQANKLYKVGFSSPTGEAISTSLPVAYAKGINLRLQNNPFYDKVILNITGTTDSSGDDFKLMIHKDGDFKTYPITIDPKTNKAVFVLQKEELPYGVNTVTVFDANDKPVLERLFFNNTKKDIEDLSVRILGKEDDSIVIGLKSITNRGILNMSISVLPENTISYNHQENIKSTFYLKPYLRGYIERPNYYFKATTPKKEYELDLLLLTQGWSRYRWFDVVNNIPDVNYEFEDGMTLSVNLNNKNTFSGDEKLMIHKSTNHGDQILDIKPNEDQIVVTNFFPQNNEVLYFSVLDKSGKMKRLNGYANLSSNAMIDKLANLNNSSNISSLKSSIENGGQETINLIRDDNTISLDNVTVFENKVERLADKNILVPAYMKSKVTEVGVNDARTFPRFTDIIRSKGYEISEGLGSINIRSRRGGGVLLVIDGVRQPNFDVLINLPSTQIESFFFDRLSRYEGAMSQNLETFYVFTRKGQELNVTPGIENFKSQNALNYLVKNGFEKNKEFYTPAYSTYLDKSFENFGVVHWEPNLSIDANRETSFKVLNTQNNHITIYIEGMNSNGNLISTRKTISISD